MSFVTSSDFLRVSLSPSIRLKPGAPSTLTAIAPFSLLCGTTFITLLYESITGFADCDEEHMLRGSIDAAFEEDGELVIIDYKTDRAKTMVELKEKYSTQLQLYKIGLSSTLNLPVKECVIYSFYLNDFIEV